MENEIDLLAELAKATEPKPEAKTSTEQTYNNDAGANVQAYTPTFGESSNDDFEPAPPPPIDDTTDENEETINAEDLTDLVMLGTDLVLKNIFPMLYRNTLPAEERKMLNSLIREKKKGKDGVLTTEMQAAEEMYLDYTDYVDSLPLTKDENKQLKKPLAAELSKINFKVGSSNLLFVTALMIFAPRLIPVAKNKFF